MICPAFCRLPFVIIVLLLPGTMVPATAATLISDPLTGSTTIGQIKGAVVFVPEGGFRSSGGKIVYDAGRPIRDGYFEAQMRGWTAPAQGVDKSHPLAGWELADAYSHYAQKGSFWNWRIGAGYNPFKVLAAAQAIETRKEQRTGSNSAVNGDGIDRKHTYRVAWKDGTVEFFFDGTLLHSFTFNRFEIRYFTIGKDDQYGVTSPAPVISDVVVVDNESPVAAIAPVGAAASCPSPGHAVVTAARQTLREHPVFQLQGRVGRVLPASACFISTGGCHD